MKKIILGMTGASGTVYGMRLLDVMLQTGNDVHLVVSPSWRQVAQQERGETQENIDRFFQRKASCESLTVYNPDDFSAAIASGSFLNDGMVIAPCSGSTLGAIAAGVHRHLIHRAAEVQLKERRSLILLVRESPLSLIHIENMQRITLAGGIIQPASPHFYASQNITADDLVDSVVARTLDLLHIEHNVGRRWNTPHRISI
jgi:4-hydroxy-3-polyprenylbenzoate decarboxylase